MAEYKHYVSKINKDVDESVSVYINKCERRYANVLRQAAREITTMDGINKILMLAGPSSSGKTTSANKIARTIARMSHNAYVLSLDDFYKNRNDIPFGEDGKQDFETVYALELDVLTECLYNLTNKGEANIPQFDFTTGIRTDNVCTLKLEPTDIVIVEGLHALNPVITDCLPADHLYKAYVSTASDIYDEFDDIFLTKQEIRLLRRMIRDFNFRACSVENFYNMWPKVIAGEEEYLVPNIKYADTILDSFHTYEVGIYKDTAIELLKQLPKSSDYYADAVILGYKLSKIRSVSKDLIPKHSLLREFVGD